MKDERAGALSLSSLILHPFPVPSAERRQSNVQPAPTPLPTTTYPIEKLLQLWRNGELTETQAIGHLLQHVAWLEGQGPAQPKPGQPLPKPDK